MWRAAYCKEAVAGPEVRAGDLGVRGAMAAVPQRTEWICPWIL